MGPLPHLLTKALNVVRQFPGEEAAIDRYMDLHEGARGDDTRVFLKVLPTWVAKFVIKFSLVKQFSWIFSGDYVKTLQVRAKARKPLRVVKHVSSPTRGLAPCRAWFRG